jgi:uncharacterized protein YndB with AHSA1/START domain
MADMMEETDDRLVIRKLIPASREEVFAAWSDPAGMRYWMCPGDVILAEAQLDFRVGGRFRILMKGEREDYEHSGTYQEIEPPSKLSFTWISAGTDLKTTLVTVQFFERDGGTELILTHERLPSADRVRRHLGGWAQIADRLAEHLQKSRSDTNTQSARRG